MPVQRTSSAAYHSLHHDRKIQRVIDIMKRYEDRLPMAVFEIRALTGLAFNEVGPPITWGMKEGTIIQSGIQHVNPDTGMSCNTYRLPKEGETPSIQEQLKLWEGG